MDDSIVTLTAVGSQFIHYETRKKVSTASSNTSQEVSQIDPTFSAVEIVHTTETDIKEPWTPLLPHNVRCPQMQTMRISRTDKDITSQLLPLDLLLLRTSEITTCSTNKWLRHDQDVDSNGDTNNDNDNNDHHNSYEEKFYFQRNASFHDSFRSNEKTTNTFQFDLHSNAYYVDISRSHPNSSEISNLGSHRGSSGNDSGEIHS